MFKLNRSIALTFVTLLIGRANAVWLETGEVVESRPGIKQPYVITSPINADKTPTDRNGVKNIVLLLTGGSGAIPPVAEGTKDHQPGRVSMRGFMAEKLGLVVAVGLPSDQSQGLSLEWRETKEHAQDVAAVMDVLVKQYPAARITVLGISNGCRSAAHVAASARKALGTRLQGVVMLSCSLEAFRDDWMSAFAASSTHAKVPVLVVHHKRDSCLRLENIEAQAKWHDFITVDDAKQPRVNNVRRECGMDSAHQFGGKEAQVYQAVVDWIGTGKTSDLRY
jgi:pimeloyl-ACP methyl ester carboxylesterase